MILIIFLVILFSPAMAAVWFLYFRKKNTQEKEKFQSLVIYRRAHFDGRPSNDLKKLAEVLSLSQRDLADITDPAWLILRVLARLKKRGGINWANANEGIVKEMFSLGFTDEMIQQELRSDSREKIESAIDQFLNSSIKKQARNSFRKEAPVQTDRRTDLFEYFMKSRADEMVKKHMKVSWL